MKTFFITTTIYSFETFSIDFIESNLRTSLCPCLIKHDLLPTSIFPCYKPLGVTSFFNDRSELNLWISHCLSSIKRGFTPCCEPLGATHLFHDGSESSMRISHCLSPIKRGFTSTSIFLCCFSLTKRGFTPCCKPLGATSFFNDGPELNLWILHCILPIKRGFTSMSIFPCCVFSYETWFYIYDNISML